MSRKTGTLVLLTALLATTSIRAHHNMSAAFDFNDRVALTGTLTKVDWRNPHIYLFLDVKREGDQVEVWSMEGPSPSFFRARDISSDDFKLAVGKSVSAEASRARDHSRSGLIRTITLPDGRVISLCPQNC